MKLQPPTQNIEGAQPPECPPPALPKPMPCLRKFTFNYGALKMLNFRPYFNLNLLISTGIILGFSCPFT